MIPSLSFNRWEIIPIWKHVCDINAMGPPNLHVLEVFWYITLVFRSPKTLIFLFFWGLIAINLNLNWTNLIVVSPIFLGCFCTTFLLKQPTFSTICCQPCPVHGSLRISFARDAPWRNGKRSWKRFTLPKTNKSPWRIPCFFSGFHTIKIPKYGGFFRRFDVSAGVLLRWIPYHLQL